MMKKSIFHTVSLLVVIVGLAMTVLAQEKVTVNTGVDFYNRYIWRGLDIASTPSVQPALSVDYAGFELGAWGAYTMSRQASESDEIDFWLSYAKELENGVALTAIVTDYYFPNAGIDFFNFNDYDAVIDDTIADPGAHTIELGLSITGPQSFPITISGYINVYNEKGNNTYFQADYPLTVGETELGFFCGVTGGSKDNPDYYGADKFSAINVGVSTVREIKLSEESSLPLSVAFVLNPKAEISYLVVGISF